MTADQDPGIVPQAVERATRSSDSPLVPAVDPALRAEPVEPGEPPPDIKRTAEAVGITTWSSTEKST